MTTKEIKEINKKFAIFIKENEIPNAVMVFCSSKSGGGYRTSVVFASKVELLPYMIEYLKHAMWTVLFGKKPRKIKT